jgi:hypothetical protein
MFRLDHHCPGDQASLPHRHWRGRASGPVGSLAGAPACSGASELPKTGVRPRRMARDHLCPVGVPLTPLCLHFRSQVACDSGRSISRLTICLGVLAPSCCTRLVRGPGVPRFRTAVSAGRSLHQRIHRFRWSSLRVLPPRTLSPRDSTLYRNDSTCIEAGPDTFPLTFSRHELGSEQLCLLHYECHGGLLLIRWVLVLCEQATDMSAE